MIVEITTPDEKRAHVIGLEVVAYADDVVAGDKGDTPAVAVILRGGMTLIAKYETLKSFGDRLQAARGGLPFSVYPLPVTERSATVEKAKPAKEKPTK